MGASRVLVMKANGREVGRRPMKNDIIDELFRKHYNEALLYVLALCRDRATAEDIVSTAFFRALESADGSIGNFHAWLLAVCRNEYLSQMRRAKHMSGEEVSEAVAAGNEELIEQVIRQEEYRALYRAIERLNEGQREAITLFYFSGLTVREVAQLTGRSETNTKVTLCRAREALKKSMEEMR